MAASAPAPCRPLSRLPPLGMKGSVLLTSIPLNLFRYEKSMKGAYNPSRLQSDKGLKARVWALVQSRRTEN